jgi:hypothetical protein
LFILVRVRRNPYTKALVAEMEAFRAKIDAARIEERGLIYATVDLAFTTPAGETSELPFVEIMHVGPEGIVFDAFAKLAESQSFF